jgi:hypothetical protein
LLNISHHSTVITNAKKNREVRLPVVSHTNY